MLRLLRDRVRVALCHDRVVIVHLKAGLRPRVAFKQVNKFVESEGGWKSALATLKSALDKPDFRNAEATLIVSNYFLNFMMLPWSDVPLTESEKLSMLQHRFAEVYGEPSTAWTLRLYEGTYGTPSLASALDQGFLEQLISIFSSSKLRLVSIQPFLMTAFNECSRYFGHDPAWFIVAEKGVFCVGLIQDNQWQSVRLRRIESDYFEEMILVLEREKLLFEVGNDNSKVFLYAPDYLLLPEVRSGPLNVQSLLPDSRFAFSKEDMSIYAMAAAGA